MLFDIGETCNDIFIIMSGMVDIFIADNFGAEEHLDVLGRGSILGINFILVKEQWVYRAVNNTSLAAKIFVIPHSSINKLKNDFQ